MESKERELAKSLFQFKKKTEILETEKYQLKNQIIDLKEELQKRNLELGRNKSKIQDFSMSLTTLGE